MKFNDNKRARKPRSIACQGDSYVGTASKLTEEMTGHEVVIMAADADSLMDVLKRFRPLIAWDREKFANIRIIKR